MYRLAGVLATASLVDVPAAPSLPVVGRADCLGHIFQLGQQIRLQQSSTLAVGGYLAETLGELFAGDRAAPRR
jgi:hypothetical protein